jgi:hypothetical protein
MDGNSRPVNFQAYETEVLVEGQPVQVNWSPDGVGVIRGVIPQGVGPGPWTVDVRISDANGELASDRLLVRPAPGPVVVSRR